MHCDHHNYVIDICIIRAAAYSSNHGFSWRDDCRKQTRPGGYCLPLRRLLSHSRHSIAPTDLARTRDADVLRPAPLRYRCVLDPPVPLIQLQKASTPRPPLKRRWRSFWEISRRKNIYAVDAVRWYWLGPSGQSTICGRVWQHRRYDAEISFFPVKEGKGRDDDDEAGTA